MAKNPLPKATFRAYLQAMPADETVGYACDGNNCPIALACKRTGYYSANANELAITWLDGKAAPTRKWQRNFINEVDLRVKGTPINAALALNILASL